jgi:hypothetical protein
VEEGHRSYGHSSPSCDSSSAQQRGRGRPKSAELLPNLSPKDLYASDLLLNFFKAAQSVDGKSEGGSTTFENDSASSLGGKHRSYASSLSAEPSSPSHSSEAESKVSSADDGFEHSTREKSASYDNCWDAQSRSFLEAIELGCGGSSSDGGSSREEGSKRSFDALRRDGSSPLAKRVKAGFI